MAATVLGVAGLIAAIVVVVVLLAGDERDSGHTKAPPPKPPPVLAGLHGTGLEQRVQFRPGDPGYVAWVGAWTMPDDSLMVSYTQAKGPVEAARRDQVPPGVLRDFGVDALPANRDFWGLDLSVRYARSGDGGATWDEVRADPFKAIAPHPYSGQADIALDDGTLVRRVNGDDLRQDGDIPHTAFLQYLTPGATTWGKPQVLLDPEKHTYQITRLRKLADGRLIATGNAWDVPASVKPGERDKAASRFLIMVSRDDGQTWKEALTIPQSTGPLRGNEWDTAELYNGDLLAVMRTAEAGDADKPVVKQAVLRKDGDGWVLRDLRTTTFPVTGHPELLATREGPILYLATSGAQVTQDFGKTWQPLRMDDTKDGLYRTHYYPRAVQTSDGVIHVFSHIGGDDPYESGPAGIYDDSFRLAGRRTAPASGGA
jgi:hypothetical protein